MKAHSILPRIQSWCFRNSKVVVPTSKTMKLGCPICIGLAFLRRLFDFVAEHTFHLYRLVFSTLQNQASKTVTLGNPPPFPAAEVLSPPLVGEDNNKRGEEEDTMIVVPEKRAPKKTVSINENVEEIKKLKRRKKSKEKLLSSMEEEQAEPPKRLKSILKVSSNVNDQFK